MQSHINDKFREYFSLLPQNVQKDARNSYKLWKRDSTHPSLHFKPLAGKAGKEGFWSIRIGQGYRALGLKEGDEISWVWIGSHASYDKRL